MGSTSGGNSRGVGPAATAGGLSAPASADDAASGVVISGAPAVKSPGVPLLLALRAPGAHEGRSPRRCAPKAARTATAAAAAKASTNQGTGALAACPGSREATRLPLVAGWSVVAGARPGLLAPTPAGVWEAPEKYSWTGWAEATARQFPATLDAPGPEAATGGNVIVTVATLVVAGTCQ